MPRQWRKSRTFSEAFRHAWDGMRFAFKNERNFRVQLVIYVSVLLLGLAIQLSATSLALIVLAASIILVLELVNTAIEVLSNVVSPEYHEGLRRVKDIAAGSVMVASIAAVLVGLLLFIPALL